ncbi:MAG TPA: hypothetical protein PLQ22_02885 [Bacilli bacterium]|jgi:hypothetical protein|nr:hypothetical protein [Bacilli bacterium]HOQ78948.1 hypothetical protein [Candidatus Absconditabacterales bacterium]
MGKNIYLPIDTKSLYYNIHNDNKTGHTCTVATPIKQGKSVNSELAKIYDIPKSIDLDYDVELVDYLNKSSKSTTRIDKAFIFNKYTVNGIHINCDADYCIFIKEEIDSNKKQFGRLKLHYPISAFYDGKYSFDNKKVINAISNKLNNFAFIVRGFEYSFDTDILNFDVDVIGYNNIPYSKVFINNKGVGNKHIANYVDIYENYDYEVMGLREKFNKEIINTKNYFELYHIAKIEALNIVAEYLNVKKDFLSISYPYSFYDLSTYKNNVKKYIIVFFTTAKELYFNISMKQLSFFNMFKNYIEIYNVTNLFNNYKINRFSYEDLTKFHKTISTIVLR